MSRHWWLSLLLLTIHVALVVSIDKTKKQIKVLREFETISNSNANVKQCLWYAMREYNEESKDDSIFLVSRILHAHLQITDRMEYLIDVEIGRSSCRKPLNNDEDCIIHEDPDLKKAERCSFLISALPWNGEFTVLKKQCKNA
ncbi:cystatin-8 [Sciurus carolinensis]|uniref:cystatin-8 n=1 Tax=Sciurus carolinensis TaxID=30640 RepID=UPI001FB2B495|nr:cystatin-8 [Sciurus carolinensis]